MFRCVGGTVCFVKFFKTVKHKIRLNIITTLPPPLSFSLSLSLCHYISIGKTTDYFLLRKSYKTPKHDVRSTEKCREFERRSRSYAVKA